MTCAWHQRYETDARFDRPAGGKTRGMSEERTDRAPTDEPDGTPAYAASLRAPGESVRPARPRDLTDEEIAPDAAPTGEPVTDRPTDGVESRAGYDVEAVSGDTDIYRPD
jgi:hypothetical protein